MGTMVAFVIGIFLLVTAWKGVVTVPQGMEYTIERFGKYRATFSPGFHWLVPYVDRIGRKMSMMEQVLDVPSQEVITKDNAMVGVDGVVFFQVLDAPKAAYEVHNLEYAIMQLAQTNLRTVMGSMDLDELLSQRDHINTRLLGVIDDAGEAVEARLVRHQLPDRDQLLPGLRELGPVGGHRLVVVDLSAIGQEVQRGRGDALGGRPRDGHGVLGPRRPALIPGSAPGVDHLLALEVDGDRAAVPTVPGRVLVQEVGDGAEGRMDVAVEHPSTLPRTGRQTGT